MISETDPLGNTKYFGYNKNSEIVSVTDRNGNTTEYTLDGNGNIVTVTDAAGTESHYTYDSMNQLTKISMHRVDKLHKVDEWQETLYTYDHRGLVKTEVNAKGDGKVFVYDENGNLISKTDEDGYVTEYSYSPVNLVSGINYNGAKQASYLYNGTGELIEMTDWNGTTTFERDLLNRLVKVTDHDGNVVEYGWDNVGNKTVQGYPDGTQADYYYDNENQIVEVVDPDGDITKFEYDANGNRIFKEYPNYETAYYFYDACDRVIEMDEFDLGGKKLFKTTYSWDAEGNLLTEMQYNHGQSGASAVTVDTAQLGETYTAIVEKASTEAEIPTVETYAAIAEETETTVETPSVELPVAFEGTETEEAAEAPALIGTEVFQTETEESTAVSETVDVDAPTAETEVPTAEVEAPTVEVEAPEVSTETTDNTETGDSSDNSSSGNPEGFEWGNGNGEVPPGPNRREKADK